MIRQKKNAVSCWDKKEKSNTRKNHNTTRVNKPGGTGERRKIKKISRKDKTIRTKQDILNNEKQFYQQVGGDGKKTYQQPDAREAK